jgi:hypothetical protein
MNDAFLVCRVERLGDLGRDRERLVDRDRALHEAIGQRQPLDELDDEIVRTDVVERADFGMVQRRDRAPLAREALAEAIVGRLDRDVAVEPSVARLVHATHPAGTEHALDPVRAEQRSGGELIHRGERLAAIIPLRARASTRVARGVSSVARSARVSAAARRRSARPQRPDGCAGGS